MEVEFPPVCRVCLGIQEGLRRPIHCAVDHEMTKFVVEKEGTLRIIYIYDYIYNM